MKNEYLQQAENFLKTTGATLSIEFLKNDYHFSEDKEKRDIYKCTLSKGKRCYTFEFGNSLNNSGFYVTIGANKQYIDRKYIDSKNLHHIIRHSINYNFNPRIDKVHYPVAPNSYDIIACLQKYDIGTFEDFCNEFGYSTDSRSAKKTYKAVFKEWLNINRLFNEEEIEKMSEIQ